LVVALKSRTLHAWLHGGGAAMRLVRLVRLIRRSSIRRGGMTAVERHTLSSPAARGRGGFWSSVKGVGQTSQGRSTRWGGAHLSRLANLPHVASMRQGTRQCQQAGKGRVITTQGGQDRTVAHQGGQDRTVTRPTPTGATTRRALGTTPSEPAHRAPPNKAEPPAREAYTDQAGETPRAKEQRATSTGNGTGRQQERQHRRNAPPQKPSQGTAHNRHRPCDARA